MIPKRFTLFAFSMLAVLVYVGGLSHVAAQTETRNGSLPIPYTNPQDGGVHAYSDPFPIIIDFGIAPAGVDDEDSSVNRGDDSVTLTLATLDGEDVLPLASTANGQRWRLQAPGIDSGGHTLVINGRDEAGNTLANDLVVTFTVRPRPRFPVELTPGWNLISFPREFAEDSVDSVFGSNLPVTTVFQFDPDVPGGWRGAFREQVASPLIFGPFVGDLESVDAAHGLWVYSLAQTTMGAVLSGMSGGPFGGAPTVPSAIDVRRGWNLVPVFDITSRLGPGDVIDADVYFGSLGDDITRILTYDTLTGRWINIVRDGIAETGTQEQITLPATPGACATCPLGANERVEIGRAYWIFATQDGSLIP